MKLKEKCPEFRFFIHEGSCDGENAKLYGQRIEKNSIPGELVPYFSDYSEKKAEREWLNIFKDAKNEYFVPSNEGGDITIYIANNFDVFFNFTNMSPEWLIGNMKKDPISEICRRIKEEDIPALNAARKITLSELAKGYGDESSEKIFEEDDYKIFLLNKYLGDSLTEKQS